MAILINEQKMVDDNTFLYEEKIKSPTSRFLDTTPVYVTYYHINNNESTTDDGFVDVDAFIGPTSPLRFNKVENFPMYGIDQIVLQMQDSEVGIDSTYEGDGIILPATIKPLVNDYFIIPVLHDDYVFRVTNISYDNVMPDNFYKIEFKLEYIDKEELHQLDMQKIDDYVCVLENIGTDTNCIIEKSEFVKIKEIEKMYQNIIEFYTAMFYNERHNVFLCPESDGLRSLYDPMQAEFINKHSLFKIKNDLSSTILTDQFSDKQRMLKYSKSIYKCIELRDSRLVSNFKYTKRPGITIHESSFYRWHEKLIDVLDIPMIIPANAESILSDDFINQIRNDEDTNSEHAKLIKKFIRNETIRVKDIKLDLDQELIYLNNSFEVFFFTPIIMYIIRDTIKKELEIQKEI